VRWPLLLGAAAVLAAAIGLVVLVRGDDGPRPGAAPTASGARSTAGRAGLAPRPVHDPLVIDASPLPTAEEDAEARARVLAEYQRPPNLSPEVVKSNQRVKPMRQARDAYADGDYPLALERAQDVLALDPDDRQARMYAAMAACAMGDAGLAQAHADKMEPTQKVRAADKCKGHGITLRDVPDLPED
jgi:hypothetical protein